MKTYNKIIDDRFDTYEIEHGVPKAYVYKNKSRKGYQILIADNREIDGSEYGQGKYIALSFVDGAFEDTFEKATKTALKKLDELTQKEKK